MDGLDWLIVGFWGEQVLRHRRLVRRNSQIVARDIYEEVPGFRSRLRHTSVLFPRQLLCIRHF